MDKLILIDGNSIMNRAFYGIMGSKMLTTKDGKYTNAVPLWRTTETLPFHKIHGNNLIWFSYKSTL